MNNFERFCFNLLGMRMKAKREQYFQLRNDLISARPKTTFEVYISTAIVSSIFVGISAAIGLGFLTWYFKLPDLIKYKGEVPETVVFLSHYSLVLGTVFVIIFSLLVFGGMTYAILLVYPSIVAGNRRRNIDATLPYAINYITSMSTAGITRQRSSACWGTAPSTAKVPWKRGISPGRSTSSEGPYRCAQDCLFEHSLPADERVFAGCDGQYLQRREPHGLFPYQANQYALENRQTQKLFLDTLALIAESYVTAMVAGTLFLIILQSIMSVLGGDPRPMFLYVIIYLMIPFGTVMFIIMISSMTPES